MKHFVAQELVPPEVFAARGAKSLELFDHNLLRLLDWLRDRYGPAVINNWHLGGQFSQSGLRTVAFYGSESKYHASFSQHKYGRAADLKFSRKDAVEVREDLKLQWSANGLGFPISIEEGVSWLHVDTRPHTGLIKFFKP